ncbi:MAG: galactokinase, partial [Chloroflexi bacterium]|nr:galactokinase [Chloroflexota bacterium]
MSLADKVKQRFHAEFGESPAFIVRAPGRVNLIGEHTDYNDGFVMPLAIDRATWIALRPRADKRVLAISIDMDDRRDFALDELRRPAAIAWSDYLIGVAWSLQERGYALQGWEGVISGDVPIGSGLSSSAALELAVARAFHCVSGFAWDAAAMALACQAAENHWLGVNCGIMDQMISAAGIADRALLIDCRSLETTTAPLPPDTAVVILDTGTRRGLVDSEYNQRRAQCEAAARHFGIAALRDIDLATFLEREHELDPLIRKRASHVVSENARTLSARDAMGRGDADYLGQLMIASHISLHEDFEVSSPALDAIVDCANIDAACFGARMTGAGFGGCAVALVRADAASAFAERVAAKYRAETGNEPAVYITRASGGAETVAQLTPTPKP